MGKILKVFMFLWVVPVYGLAATAAEPRIGPAPDSAVQINISGFRADAALRALATRVTLQNLGDASQGGLKLLFRLCHRRDEARGLFDGERGVSNTVCSYQFTSEEEVSIPPHATREIAVIVPLPPEVLKEEKVVVLELGDAEDGSYGRVVTPLPPLEEVERIALALDISNVVIRKRRDYGNVDEPPFFGVVFDRGEEPHLALTVANLSDARILAAPQLDVYRRGPWGRRISSVRGEAFTLAPKAQQEISVRLPFPDEPQSYLAFLSFVDSRGRPLSEIVSGRYVIRGESAGARSITVQPSKLKAGDTALVSFLAYGSADTGFPGAESDDTPIGEVIAALELRDRLTQELVGKSELALTLDKQNGNGVQVEAPIRTERDSEDFTVVLDIRRGESVVHRSAVNFVDRRNAEQIAKTTAGAAGAGATTRGPAVPPLVAIVFGVLVMYLLIVAQGDVDKKR